MATRTTGSPKLPRNLDLPDVNEQVRLVAKAVDDMRRVILLINQNAAHFLPGESHDEMKRAWDEASATFEEVIQAVLNGGTVSDEAGRAVTLSEEILEDNQLLGHVGQAKTSALRRWKERLLSLWSTFPERDVQKTAAVAAGLEYLELAANVVSSIPGGGPIKELLGLYKQQLKFRVASSHD